MLEQSNDQDRTATQHAQKAEEQKPERDKSVIFLIAAVIAIIILAFVYR